MLDLRIPGYFGFGWGWYNIGLLGLVYLVLGFMICLYGCSDTSAGMVVVSRILW